MIESGMTATRRKLFTAVGGLALASIALRSGGAGAASDLAAIEQANLKTHDDFVRLWNAETPDPEKLAGFFTEDGLVHTGVHSGHHQLFVGRAAILQQFKGDFTDGRYYFDLMKTWSAGPIVAHSRTHRTTKKGPNPGPMVGLFYIKDGKIQEWGEYVY